MKSKNIWLFGLVLLITLSITGWAGYAQRTSPSRQAWEYKIIGAPQEQHLNELGAQGWEMVACTDDNGNTRCYLKRAK